MKVGVLVVAYNAESTLVDVLDRIPPAASLQLAEVLVRDDHSTDETHEVASTYLQRESHLNLSVVRHEQNLGYGGNQKAGYLYALDHGWDVVVLLHGDGQYAPEIMGDIIDPIVHGDADAVFGSRMMQPGRARKGGMPLYKYLGNRILSTTQNALTGLELSEWHSGYRAYRVSALADLPFLANSDGFDFDTEIILQLAAAKKKIVEVPIPTYYGDEICRVNGMRYAADVIVDTMRYRLGRSGFGTGQLGHVTEPYAFKPSAYSSHGRILQMLESRPPQRILDVGCGAGWLAGALTAAGHTVTGVDLTETSSVHEQMERFVRADLAAGLPDELDEDYDVVLAADVIEHLADPSRLLRDMAERAAPNGTIIASVPNVGHWYPRARFTAGRFDYDQRGILDSTHLRFFTRRSFLRIAGEAGLTPMSATHTGLPLDALGLSDSGTVVGAISSIDRTLVRLWPTLFAYQFVFEFAARNLEPVGDLSASH
jgi:2-polyprenyl-3-methyl-5-hydroxy-6-metoxy-1,4-benzoquinol methylase